MKFICLFITIVTFNAVYSKTIQEGLIESKTCTIDKEKNYPGYYNLITLKCDWHQFAIFMNDTSHFDKDSDRVYDIEFTKTSKNIVSKISPYEVTDELFSRLTLRKLVLKGLDIKRVSKNAFKGCCEKTLQSLDLSRNKLMRIDADVMSHLKALQNLDLSNNRFLQLTGGNFQNNVNLVSISLASNEMEYLPEKVFLNLHLLNTVDLSNNNLRTLDACTFYPIYSDLEYLQKSDSSVSKASINALNNDIECNCGVFFLARAARFNISVVCQGEPSFYRSKNLNELHKEDPDSVKCFYKTMKYDCESKYKSSNLLMKQYETMVPLVIVFSCFTALFLFISLCLCCRLRSAKNYRKI